MGTFTKVFAALIGAVVLVTLMTGGKFALGAGPQGPTFSVGFSGPG